MLVCPVSIGAELGGEVFHLIGQYPVFSEVVPLVAVRFKRHGKQGHPGLLRRLAVFEPVATLAGCDHVLPFVGTATRCWNHVVSGQVATAKLIAAVEATMVVAAKQGSVAQWRREVIEYATVERDDGLQGYLRSNASEALHAAKHWGEGLPDAVDDIAASVRRDRCLEA